MDPPTGDHRSHPMDQHVRLQHANVLESPLSLFLSLPPSSSLLLHPLPSGMKSASLRIFANVNAPPSTPSPPPPRAPRRPTPRPPRRALSRPTSTRRAAEVTGGRSGRMGRGHRRYWGRSRPLPGGRTCSTSARSTRVSSTRAKTTRTRPSPTPRPSGASTGGGPPSRPRARRLFPARYASFFVYM